MMKNSFFYIFVFALLWCIPCTAQQDSINHLEEVFLSDLRLYAGSGGNRIESLKDSVIERNSPTLSDLLKFNTPLYLKENGAGMVASPSFRGTTASQTAVIWNGININSGFTGQVDFNSLLAAQYDEIVVRAGGGSVLYGSGAIGGSIHLQNQFRFAEGFENRLRFGVGSFETYFGSYESQYSSEKTSLYLTATHHRSENNFPYYESDARNENGDFGRTAINTGLGHFLDGNNILNFYSSLSMGERGFSGTVTAASKSGYKDLNLRNLLEWTGLYGNFTSTSKAAYLFEKFEFLENRKRAVTSDGEMDTAVLKYDLEYELNPEISISALADLIYSRARGSNIGRAERTTGSTGLMLEHRLGNFQYQLAGRKEFSDTYESPFLFSASGGYAFSNNYQLKFNFSRNYRIPTFNDMYWYAGGNTELLPEESLQAEVAQNVSYKDFNLSLTGYIIEVKNLLRWVPTSSGLWKPENTREVRNSGLELVAEWQKSFGENAFSANTIYAYSHSEDLLLEKQLIYVPAHKATAAAAFSRKRFSAYWQTLYSGALYTSSDNNYSLPAYSVSNIGVEYRLFQELAEVGFRIENIFGAEYQSMPSRPMPGRSLMINLTLIL